MDLVRCWGCGHLGPDGDPEGLCPLCRELADGDPRQPKAEAVPPSDIRTGEDMERDILAGLPEPALGPLFAALGGAKS